MASVASSMTAEHGEWIGMGTCCILDIKKWETTGRHAYWSWIRQTFYHVQIELTISKQATVIASAFFFLGDSASYEFSAQGIVFCYTPCLALQHHLAFALKIFILISQFLEVPNIEILGFACMNYLQTRNLHD